MSAIAIITARGGSKRIPKKNIKEFCGKPIIAYSIEAALQSGVFDEVMVSTDSEEIACIAKEYGANVPFLRSEKNSDDYASTVDVLLEVLEMYASLGREFDLVGCIYPTAPFITGEKIEKALEIIKSGDVSSVMTVTKFSFPPQRAMLISSSGVLVYQYPEFAAKRSQDLESVYHDCGQLYICKTEHLISNKSVVSDKTAPLIVPEEEVQDIDNISDWFIAEAKYNALHR